MTLAAVFAKRRGTRRGGGGGGASPPVETLKDTGRIGGQVGSLIDFSAFMLTNDWGKRIRNIAPGSGTPQFVEATCLLQVASLSRNSGTGLTTVTLSAAPESYQDRADLVTGYLLVLHNPCDTSFEVDQVPLTRIDATHFTYPNAGATASYKTVNLYDGAATMICQVAKGADGQPNANCTVVYMGGATNPDANGSYTGRFKAGIPGTMAWTGLTVAWTPGAPTFTFTYSGASSTCYAVYGALPSDFELPEIVRNDHSSATLLRPDAKQFLSRFGFQRYMDLRRTNANAFVKSWAGRAKIACGLGMITEDQVRMSNELQQDMWIAIPSWAADDYIIGELNLIDSLLDPSLHLFVEWDNEATFNERFPQYHWNRARVRALLKAYFHGFAPNGAGEDVIQSVVKVSGTTTVTMKTGYPVRFNNGDTAVFKITGGDTSGYNTPDAGATCTVAVDHMSFSFGGNSGSSSASFTAAMIIGNPADVMYSDGKDEDPRSYPTRMHTKRSYEVSQVVSGVFGGLGSRAHMVLMCFEEQHFHQFNAITWLESHYGPINAWCSAIGVAPYPLLTGANLAALLTSFGTLMTAIDGRTDTLVAFAAARGVEVWNYEYDISLASVSDGALRDSTHTDPIGGTMLKAITQRTLAHGANKQCLYLASPGVTGTPADQHWHNALSLSGDKTYGSATDERMKGIDAALAEAPP